MITYAYNIVSDKNGAPFTMNFEKEMFVEEKEEPDMALRSRVQYDCLEVKDLAIPNVVTTNDAARTLTGFTMNGSVAFCIKKSNAVDESVIFRINNFIKTDASQAEKPVIKTKEIPYTSRGMAYHDLHLYIATGKDIVVKVPTSATSTQTEEIKVVTLDGKNFNSQAITRRSNGKFTLMGNKLNVGSDYLCFADFILNEDTMTLTEAVGSRFYVKNTGYTRIRDIYYNNKYGLFIVTNKMDGSSYTTANLILRVDFAREDASGYNGCKLYYPVAQLDFTGDTAIYQQLTVESVYISPEDSKMYVAANTALQPGKTEADGLVQDGILHAGNLRFYKDAPFYAKLYTERRVAIPSVTVNIEGTSLVCYNPGAFAMDDSDNGYCVSSYTKDDMPYCNEASVFLKSDDINRNDFERINKQKIYRNLGHANGMAYYNHALYVAAYNRDIKQKNIVKLSLTGEELAVYTAERTIGGISHYKENQFILVDYDGPAVDVSYAMKPRFYIGYFDDVKKVFKVNKTFTVINPTFNKNSSSNFLQDMHYDEKFGLYFVTLTDGADYMYRVFPEHVDDAADLGSEISPDEQSILGGVGELETLYISRTGKMYVVNAGESDQLNVVTTLDFFE